MSSNPMAGLSAEQAGFLRAMLADLMPGEDPAGFWVDVTSLDDRRIARSLAARGLLEMRGADSRVGLMEVRLAGPAASVQSAAA